MTQEQDNNGGSIEADGRFWIEILSWNWNLSLAISTTTPEEYRFQGGLDYVRGFDLRGRVLSPHASRDVPIRVWLSPFGEPIRFGPRDLNEVGRLYTAPPDNNLSAELTASLMLPEDAVGPLATCLGRVSKYLLITTSDWAQDEASVDRYAFSSTLPEGVPP